MHILITGGTGLIGRRICKALLAEGHQLTVLSRHPETVAAKCGNGVRAITTLDEWLPEQMVDAIINLAGEPIADVHWTTARKQVLWDSRVTLTARLVQRIVAAEHKPAVLLSGSAVGYYGNQGNLELDESAGTGDDFAAHLCKTWEDVALSAESQGVRVCLLRTGLILSKDGGLLGRMLLPFKLGLGARMGDGKQWMSWIHIDDYVSTILRLLHEQDMRGPFNMTAPNPVTNAEFTRSLARALHRPALFVAPGFILRAAMGERASLLLEGQRVLPKKIEASGGSFAFKRLESALQDILS